MYPASAWSKVLRAIMDISAHAVSLAARPRSGPFGSPGFACAGKTGPPFRLILSQTSAGSVDFHELRKRRVDLILGHILEPFESDEMSAEILFRERTCVVAGKDSKWARRRKIDLAELVEEPWLLVPSNSVWHASIEAAFSAHGLKMPKPSVVSFSVHLRNSLLPTGMSGFCRNPSCTSARCAPR